MQKKGIKEKDAKEIVRRACVQYGRDGIALESIGTLVHVALQQKNTKDLMITKSQSPKNDKPFVAVMTKEASERMDERRKNMRKRPTRVMKGNVFTVKSGREVVDGSEIDE